MASDEVISLLFPPQVRTRVLLTHTRPEVLLAHARRLDSGPAHCSALGYRNQGGTLDSEGMLFANGCTWAHALKELARLSGQSASDWLSQEELDAISGHGDPYVVIRAPVR